MKKPTKRKSRILSLLLILALLAGLSLLLYPTAADWWNSMHQSRAIASYVESVVELDETQYESVWQAAVEYNAGIPDEDTRFLPDEEEKALYETLLNVGGDGIMGYVEIPGIDVELPIYHGTNEEILQTAVGHIEGSSLPVGGEGTHSVISGHRGLPSARLFTDLDQLEPGDTFMLHVLNETLTYEVDEINTVLPDDISHLGLEDGEDLCTLVTCTPYGVNSHRLLVRGHRVENAPEPIVDVVQIIADAAQIPQALVALIIALPVLTAVALLLRALFRRRNS